MGNTNNLKQYEWKDSYSTSLDIINEQNKKFIDIINKLINSMNGNCSKEMFSDVFFSLIHYVEEYLINEKIYFKDYNTAKFISIQNSHRQLIEKIIQFQKKYEKESSTNSCLNIVNFLIEWFENHIKIYDSQAIEYLKSKGLK